MKLIFISKDTFVKDLLLLLMVSILGAAILAMGFSLATDKYFAKAVTGVIGDFGEYDLLFETRLELKGALVRQLQQIIDEHFPGATLKQGISVVGKTTVFLTFPPQYKTKAIYNSLGSYFTNLPGNGGYSVMTEPRIDITSVPSGIFDLLSRQVEMIPGVKFTFNDGNSIGLLLDSPRVQDNVLKKIKLLLNKYQLLEVRLASQYSPEELIALGKKVSQAVLNVPGAGYAKDITMSSSTGDTQYLMSTMSEIRKFLLAYAAEVKIQPQPGQSLNVGDLLVVNGKNSVALKPGNLLEPMQVVIKVSATDASGIHGLIIQGDAGFLKDNQAYKLLSGDKVGHLAATIQVSSKKNQLLYGMDQGVKLLTQLNQTIASYNQATGGSGLTVSGVQKIYRQLAEVRYDLSNMESGVNGLTGKANRNSVLKMAGIINGMGDDLNHLAQTFGRVQFLENRFRTALSGLQNAQFLLGSPLLQSTVGEAGGINDKMKLLNSQLDTVYNSLSDRVRSMDDFINRFNPVVSTLLSWRNKAKELAVQADNFGAAFTPGSENHRKLVELTRSTDRVIGVLREFDMSGVQNGVAMAASQLFGSDKIDLSGLIAELEHVRDSLPKLMDEEIGHSVSLIDQYVGGDVVSGQRIQLFTKADLDQSTVNQQIKNVLHAEQVAVFSLPVGTIQPDLRGQVFQILGEVRSTIAALVVLILWVLTFILDQSLIISMLKVMRKPLLPKLAIKNRWVAKGYLMAGNILNSANIYAMVMGGLWLGGTFALAGAKIPYLNYTEIIIFGGLLGVLIAGLAEKINPINRDEVMAGLSLGMEFKNVMREIVIPAGRPGLLQFLNRWKMIMK